MTRRRGLVLAAAITVVAGCSAGGGGSNNGPVTTPDPDEDSGTSSQQDSGFIAVEAGDEGIDPHCTGSTNQDDDDGDGYSEAEGDCNDCSANMNPGAYDYPDNGIDEDCNGTPDDEPVGCEDGLPADGDGFAAARALGLCRQSHPEATGRDRTWGVLKAAWVFADGSTSSVYDSRFGSSNCLGQGGTGAPPNALGHAIVSRFGTLSARAGSSMLVLSSGLASEAVFGGSPTGAALCTKSAAPEGFPTPSLLCDDQQIDKTAIAMDPMALELTIRAPTNAKSLSFEFNFFTTEYPSWVCDKYNDFFVVLLYSQHESVPANHNISFDAQGNPVSVNNGFLEACKAGIHGKYGQRSFACPLGEGMLGGTDFMGHGATGWLKTSSPIKPGEELTVRFAVWDSYDMALDSTVLLDTFQWELSEGQIETERPPIK